MRSRLVSMFATLCCSLLVLGVLAIVPAHGDDDTAAARLYLNSGDGITALDATTGTTTFSTHGGIASGDWQRLVSATAAGDGTTTLRAVDAFDGEVVSDTALRGTLDVRAVSFHGDLVALSPD